MCKCLYCIKTFFGLNPENDPDIKLKIEKQLDFLHFWGGYSFNELKKMAIWRRKLYIEWTISNIEHLFGKKD